MKHWVIWKVFDGSFDIVEKNLNDRHKENTSFLIILNQAFDILKPRYFRDHEQVQ